MLLVFPNEFLIDNCNDISAMCIELGISPESLKNEGTQNLTLETAKKYGLMYEYKEIEEVEVAVV